jgi:hypothetical protein
MLLFHLLLALLRTIIQDCSQLLLEILALRHQPLVLHRSAKQPRLRQTDQLFWIFLSSFWKDWRPSLALVRPETVVAWHNPYAERVIGSIWRECLAHVIVFSENHPRRLLKTYIDYYNEPRPRLSLERNAPVPRDIEPPSKGRVIAIPQVGGLHHRYQRAA